jgi:hypothetical protein
MCYPSIQSLVFEKLEICANHVDLGIGTFLVVDCTVEMAFVIMAELIGASDPDLAL